MTHLYLARHGETEENVAQILQGLMPGHLTACGREQAAELRDKLVAAHTAFDVMLTSDLQRALDTANIINGGLHLPLSPCPLLRERDWGGFTGKFIPSLKGRPWPDDVETLDHMKQRAQAFMAWLRDAYPGKTVLAVGHGIMNKAIQSVYYDKPMNEIEKMANAEVRKLTL